MLKYLIFGVFIAIASSSKLATVVFKKGPIGNIEGTVLLNQTDDGVLITGSISGLTPGKHGFHVHEKGDLSNGCLSTGAHYNPHNKSHGAPGDTERHVGDLGNIEAGPDGIAHISIVDKIISLGSDNCIIGRAIVVHEGVDDLGKGGFDDSKTTGHAGARVGCGIIGIVDDSGANAIQGFSLVVICTSVLAALLSKFIV
uniref:Superoxide dismutase [Cu-Zn] n=1 Tax=Dastarcus helophoroides TaxID=1169899 RepID=A0A075W275_9CUCU|nr:extracellular Cu/Zn superoxide dismutase [Dastarcus helophoroides]